MKTTPEQRAKLLRWMAGNLDAQFKMYGLTYEEFFRDFIDDIEELEARLAEYEAAATLDPVIECPSCGLEISLAGGGEDE